MNIEAGARILAGFFNRSYDGLQEGTLIKEYPITNYSMHGGMNLQGHKEDVKQMVAQIIAAVCEIDEKNELDAT